MRSDLDGDPEGIRDRGGGDHLLHRTRREHQAGTQNCGVGQTGRKLFEVMGHHDHGSRGVRGHEAPKASHESLTRTKVEPGCGLVEAEEIGISHHRPRQEDLRSLTLRDDTDRTITKVARTNLLEERVGPLVIVGCVLAPPRLERPIESGDHDIVGPQGGPE